MIVITSVLYREKETKSLDAVYMFVLCISPTFLAHTAEWVGLLDEDPLQIDLAYTITLHQGYH